LGLWVFGLSSVAGVSQQQPDDALKLLDRIAERRNRDRAYRDDRTSEASCSAVQLVTDEDARLLTRLWEDASGGDEGAMIAAIAKLGTNYVTVSSVR
jgi:hypothetical protein